MKLKKINPDHYVIVNDSPIEEGEEIEKGDWYYLPRTNYVYLCEENPTELNLERHCGTAKVTHSTRPIEDWIEDGILMGKKSEKIKSLKLSEVKELIGEVDVERKSEIIAKSLYDKSKYDDFDIYDQLVHEDKELIKLGYNQAIEDNKEKRFTEEDMRKLFIHGKQLGLAVAGAIKNGSDKPDQDLWYKESIQSLQPKTEWEVEFVDGKLKLKKI